MRYINLHDLELPDGWEEKAKELSAQLTAANSKRKRSKILSDNPIWQELLVPLYRLSKGKCWYSEARDVMSDRDVDHFRPKNEARNLDGKEREGYWWLAYDWENYRLSSIYCNRRRSDKFSKVKKVGGKWSYFPLFDETAPCKSKDRLRDEDKMLLDPTDKDDPDLLTFDQNGDAVPNTSNSKEIQRVKASIDLYNLDYTPLKEERQKVWDKCQRHINEIENIRSNPNYGIADNERIKFIKEEIRRMIEPEEEFSMVAIACVEYNKYSRLLRSN